MFRKTAVRLVNSPMSLAIVFAVHILFSSIMYSVIENKDFGTSLWWTIVTICTVGYGDQFPVTGWGRALGSWTMLIFIFFLAPCVIASIISHVIDDKDKFSHDEQEKLKADLNETRTLLGEALPLLRAMISEVDSVEEENAQSEAREERLIVMMGKALERMGVSKEDIEKIATSTPVPTDEEFPTGDILIK